MALDAAPEYPDLWQDEYGAWHVRCDSEGERAVSQRIGDGSLLAVYDWVREICIKAELELSDPDDLDRLTISIPPGA